MLFYHNDSKMALGDMPVEMAVCGLSNEVGW